MKKNLRTILYLIILINLSGCGGGGDSGTTSSTGTTYSFNGSVQKGPYILGSTLYIYKLDKNFQQTGESYSTQTTDDLGSFVLEGKFKKNDYAEIVSTGYYYDEISGDLSDSPLTLKSLIKINTDETLNVNILTSLESERLKQLLNDGTSYTDAKSQVKSELLSIFGITEDVDEDLQKLNISSTGNSNAVLLAVSATLMQVAHDNASGASTVVAELSQSVSNIITDIKNDGVLNSTTYQNRIDSSKSTLDAGIVKQNLRERYSDLGIDLPIPDLENFSGNPWSKIHTFTGDSSSGMSCYENNCYLMGPFTAFKKLDLSTLVVTDLDNLPFSHAYGYIYPLRIGDKIYVPKYVSGNPNELWEYNITNDAWTQKASSNTNHQHASSGIIYNDKIYLFGDNGGTNVESYDPTNDSWTNLTSISFNRNYPSSALYNDHIYIMGQENFPIEVYDPSGNSYSTLPISNATVDASNDVYIIGVMDEKMYAVVAGCGHISDCENSSYVWEYTFPNDTWTQLGNLPTIFDQPRSIYKLENSFIILASNGVFKYTPSRDN